MHTRRSDTAEPFVAEVDWTLSEGDGDKRVYARFRNADGYLTPPVGLNLFVASALYEKGLGHIIRSVAPFVGLMLIGLGGVALWVGAVAVITLRALLQPLPAPVVAEAFPGPARVPALARQATWRDIGAGTGPLVAGFLFPVLPALAIYAGAAGLLAGSALLVYRRAD